MAMTKQKAFFVLLGCLVALLGAIVKADDPVSYEVGSDVSVFANTVGPLYNPTETYKYYSLPFCPPDAMVSDEHALGELLTGSRKVKSRYHVRFTVPKVLDSLCLKTLNLDELKAFQDAIRRQFFFELFIDDIPLRADLGYMEREGNLFLGKKRRTEKLYLYTHVEFNLAYNKDKLVKADIQTFKEKSVLLDEESLKKPLDFTYTVTWEESDLSWEKRMDAYNEARLIAENMEIRWLSVVNAFVLVMLLTLFLAIILVRILRQDFARYMETAEDDNDKEESGWKLVHGDVFRPPTHLSIFTAMIGTGAQLFFLVFALILLAILDAFNPQQRGGAMSGAIIVYVLSAGIGGYVTAKLYKQLGGTEWVWNIVSSAVMFPGPLLIVFMFVNSVAIAYESTAALPFWTIVIVLALYLLVAFPLTVIGGIIGRNTAKSFDAPCRTNKVRRQIPEQPTHKKAVVQMIVAGVLPFSAVYIEIHHVLTALWGNQFYTLFGILLLSFIMLTVATAFVTITLTYFLLNLEDHLWWWRAFGTGCVTGAFVYVYSIWYYYTSTNMSGFLQGSFYFGYMALMSYGFALMLGFVGFTCSLMFVKKIYRTIKVE